MLGVFLTITLFFAGLGGALALFVALGDALTRRLQERSAAPEHRGAISAGAMRIRPRERRERRYPLAKRGATASIPTAPATPWIKGAAPRAPHKGAVGRG